MFNVIVSENTCHRHRAGSSAAQTTDIPESNYKRFTKTVYERLSGYFNDYLLVRERTGVQVKIQELIMDYCHLDRKDYGYMHWCKWPLFPHSDTVGRACFETWAKDANECTEYTWFSIEKYIKDKKQLAEVRDLFSLLHGLILAPMRMMYLIRALPRGQNTEFDLQLIPDRYKEQILKVITAYDESTPMTLSIREFFITENQKRKKTAVYMKLKPKTVLFFDDDNTKNMACSCDTPFTIKEEVLQMINKTIETYDAYRLMGIVQDTDEYIL